MKIKFHKAETHDYMYWVSEGIFEKFAERIGEIFDRYIPTCEWWTYDLKYGVELIVAFKNKDDEAQFIMLVSSGVFDI